MLAQKYNLHPVKTNRLLQEHLEQNGIQAVQNDIENLIMQGEKYQAVALLNQLCQVLTQNRHDSCQNTSNQDQETRASLKRQLARTKKSLKDAIACHQADISTFAKFDNAIKMLREATTFNQLPAALQHVAQCIHVDAIGVVLESTRYASFVPNSIPTCAQEELQKTLREINEHGAKYIGPSRGLEHCPPLVDAIPEAMHRELHGGSWVVYPFSEKDDDSRLAGFICIFDKDIERYKPTKATDFLEHFCYILGCTISTLRAKKVLDLERLTDPLTGIPNRAYLMLYGQQILEFAERKGFPVTLLFIDLNGFKQLNDQLGHNKGDIALQQVAMSLKELVRKYDMVVRLGGDEFVVLLPGVAMKKTGGLVKRMAETIADLPLNKEHSRCCLTASIGAADFTYGQTMAQLIGVADQAMYAKKKELAEKK